MPRFSANLGLLWADLPLPDAIRAAAAAGFDAVECHWPYDQDPAAIRAALAETGLPMLGLNTRRGHAGEQGLAALPGREAEARAAIDQALDYAAAIDCGSVHVMAGLASGPAATACFHENLTYACDRAPDRMILIEPLNNGDVPGYFLSHTDQAARIIAAVARPNLRLMFDCYHVGITEGDVGARLQALAPIIGHVQFAGAPDRGRPDRGGLDYRQIFALIDRIGWTRPLGAEYRPGGPVEPTLGWMRSLV